MENHCYQITKSGLSSLNVPLLLPPSTHPALHTFLSNIIHESPLPTGIYTTTKIYRVGESRTLIPLIRSREMWWNECHVCHASSEHVSNRNIMLKNRL
jgi:prolyl-tRNA synthetase